MYHGFIPICSFLFFKVLGTSFCAVCSWQLGCVCWYTVVSNCNFLRAMSPESGSWCRCTFMFHSDCFHVQTLAVLSPKQAVWWLEQFAEGDPAWNIQKCSSSFKCIGDTRAMLFMTALYTICRAHWWDPEKVAVTSIVFSIPCMICVTVFFSGFHWRALFFCHCAVRYCMYVLLILKDKCCVPNDVDVECTSKKEVQATQRSVVRVPTTLCPGLALSFSCFKVLRCTSTVHTWVSCLCCCLVQLFMWSIVHVIQFMYIDFILSVCL